ncbi:MAG: hypothetical protein PHS37_03785 [Candidatus Omnitrophica bacterium]|nr:hypothetical protein [Candidatus Omnitrophota bacterium]
MLNTGLLIILSLAALWTVMTRSLIKSTIGLAFTSIVLTIIMFRLNSPLAAVFELSVCTGLITVIFVSTISLASPLTPKEVELLSAARLKRFWYLPVILVLVGVGLLFVKVPLDFPLPHNPAGHDVRTVLWNERVLDLFGQVIILLAGAFGVAVLFKERKKK